MQFDCGPTSEEKESAREQWHNWFAWYPVRIGRHDCRWLEVIRRKGMLHCGYEGRYWTYKYKVIKTDF